jgi:hypothetical protein
MMSLQKPEYQLTLPLDVEEIETNEPLAVSPDEARLRSETARSALDGRDVPWKSEYLKLREGGWHWRVAAYIAWASSPRTERTPSSQAELAKTYLGLTSDRVISTWRKKNPVIDEMVSVLQSAPLWDHRADVFDALVQNAAKADYKTHNDRKLFLEMTGDYTPSAKLAAMITKNGISTNELSDMTDDELLAMAKRLRDQSVDSDETVEHEDEEE